MCFVIIKTVIIALLFPRRCLGCGQKGQYFCFNCQGKIRPVKHQICPVCQKPTSDGQTHPRCQTKHSLDGLTTIFTYQGPIKRAIGQLKYRFITDLADELIKFSVRHLRNKHPHSILLPIPLHPRRQRWRGFNQSEILGKKLGKKVGWKVGTNLLFRHQDKPPQMKLKGQERKENIRGVFKLKPNFSPNLKSKKILVFDDVWTTGSTLREAGRTLKKDGFKKVWGLTLAR